MIAHGDLAVTVTVCEPGVNRVTPFEKVWTPLSWPVPVVKG